MNGDLIKTAIKIEEAIRNQNYTVLIVNKKRFSKGKTIEQLAREFVYKEDQLLEYVCNTIIYKWLVDHNDDRYKDFSYILKPDNIKIELKDVSFDELIEFISPETHKTNNKD